MMLGVEFVICSDRKAVKMFKYTDIYNKTGRFLERINNTNRNNMDYVDDLHAFFIFCYHLKDYLLKDAKIPKTILDAYINSNPALTICRNICNLTKHVNLRDSDYGTGHIGIGVTEYLCIAKVEVHGTLCKVEDENKKTGNRTKESINLDTEHEGIKNIENESSSFIDQHYDIIDTAGNKYDALEIAQECYKLWTKFLKTYDLL